MNRLKGVITSSMAVLLAAGMTLNYSACSKESPLQSAPLQLNSTKAHKRTTDELTFLKSQNPFLGKVFKVSQLITAANGGSIEVGNEKTGYSRITFKPGDLSANLNVGFWWNSNCFEVEFSPHGSNFNNPVLIRLSYKDANLTGIDEDSLKLWYYHEEEGIWEQAGHEINKQLKYVEGTITHFSRYAVAWAHKRKRN